MPKLFVTTFPVLTGQSLRYHNFSEELKMIWHKDFALARKRLSLIERTFLQFTLKGDLIILSLDGPDLKALFERFSLEKNEFSIWFSEHVKNINGVDLSNLPKGLMLELIVDSDSIVRQLTVS